ncbi:hypothetical protein [Bartonella sp. HY761]|uniref:hypothetical protein n=1 Tax=Bartonella sp. HY761 TaxID=2979330 RepID=UPI002203A803|nr:hypothetical protein [Bartonella sp. HY761]UXN05963.1 hypothetical protein N6A79_11810 [Bartonella sp. HY761]
MKLLYLVILLSGVFFNITAPAKSSSLTSIKTVSGEDLSTLSIRWWQWVTNAPDDLDPLADDTGEHCNYAQSGDVFFLAPSYSFDKVMRNCAVPKDKYIFFPVISIMRWDTGDGLSCDDLKKEVNAAINSARDMVSEFDGQKLDGTRAATSSCFTIPGDEDHYASDGYWILLNPLSEGEHHLHFKGLIGDDAAMQDEYMQDIEYKINVK